MSIQTFEIGDKVSMRETVNVAQRGAVGRVTKLTTRDNKYTIVSVHWGAFQTKEVDSDLVKA